MPHKRNPVKSEQLCGLARVLRGNLQAGLENVALWHERDISHSSVERIILPDSLHARVLRAREVHARSSRACTCIPSACCENLDASYGLVFSQPVLLALVESGPESRRRVPHGATQRDDHVGGATSVPRRARATTPTSRPRSATSALAACFDLERALANIDRTFEALDG